MLEACPPLWLIWAKIGVPDVVDRLGDAAVAGQHLGVEHVDHLLVGPVGGVHRVLFGDDQAGASGGAGRVVGRVLLGGHPPSAHSSSGAPRTRRGCAR